MDNGIEEGDLSVFEWQNHTIRNFDVRIVKNNPGVWSSLLLCICQSALKLGFLSTYAKVYLISKEQSRGLVF